MSAEVKAPNSDDAFQDAVDILVDRYGAEAAERRLLAALSAVRQRKVEAARGGDD